MLCYFRSVKNFPSFWWIHCDSHGCSDRIEILIRSIKLELSSSLSCCALVRITPIFLLLKVLQLLCKIRRLGQSNKFVVGESTPWFFKIYTFYLALLCVRKKGLIATWSVCVILASSDTKSSLIFESVCFVALRTFVFTCSLALAWHTRVAHQNLKCVPQLQTFNLTGQS